ncbi:MAG: HAD family hydrolase, partial [Candidatus Kerfeldbacteria bacterium]|nr:HAD family hydrolase [Candidatus Kerfeldbacteria bacterium]
MIKGMLFDFRDTLINVKAANQAVGATAFKLVKKIKPQLSYGKFQKDYESARQKVKKRYFQNTLIHNWTKTILLTYLESQSLKLTHQELLRWLIELDKAFIKKCHLFIDAKVTLNWLKQKHLKIGVIIDGTVRREQAIIKKLKLAKYFQIIIISEVVGKNKFTHHPLQAGLKKLKLPAKQILVVGDRLDKDIRWANKLGCQSALLRRRGGRYNQTSNNSTYKPDWT